MSTQSTPTHTPTPWRYFLQGDSTRHIIRPVGSKSIADDIAYIVSMKSQVDAEANAAHIVRCVNERAQTLELLQEIIDNIKLGECGNYSTSGDWFIEASQIVAQANAH